MFILESGARLIALAPAKLNLFFEILSKRADGFHEIETLMSPISMFDSLSFATDASGELTLTCRIEGTRIELPPVADNLVYRAVALLRTRTGVAEGARVELVKRIPTAAGLAGGSSDAAAALALANRGWKLGWSDQRLASLAAELGSDIPFFFAGGAAICRGRGERVAPLAPLGKLHVVVARPPVGLATAEVYARSTPADAPRRAEPLVDALRGGDWRAIGNAMLNRLQPAAESLTPWIERLRHAFGELDCPAAQMTGSGSSYFGLFRAARQARRAAQRLRALELGSVWVMTT